MTAGDKCFAYKSIIEWATEAAIEAVGLGDTDSEGGMGLWQSFQAQFPRSMFPGGEYDVAIMVYSTTYKSVYKAAKGAK